VSVTIRHIKRVATGTQTGAAVQFHGQWFEPLTAGLNDSDGWQGGQYETRVYQEGKFDLIFPNKAGTDSVLHRDRFGLTNTEIEYHLADEYIEIYEGGDVVYVGNIQNAPQLSRSAVQIGGFDPLALLKKQREYYAGYFVHAPRDAFEWYTKTWRLFMAEDFSDTTMYPSSQGAGTTPDGRFSYTHTLRGPATTVRIHPTTAATEGRIKAIGCQFQMGTDSNTKYDFWQVKASFTRPPFGKPVSSGDVFGDNAQVKVGLYDVPGDRNLIWIQLQERHTYVSAPYYYDPSTQGKIDAQQQTNAPGPFEIIVEGRERWIYYFVNQALVGVMAMPPGPYTVVPYISLRTGDSSTRQYIDVDNFSFRRTEPFLMRDPARPGDYHLPGIPPNGGIHGRYFSDVAIHNDGTYRAQVFSPMHFATLGDRLDKDLNFPHDGTHGTEDLQEVEGVVGGVGSNWQPPGTPSGLWWSVRWQGSIYLPLQSNDVRLRYRTKEEGARIWVGKTRWGEQLHDSWIDTSGAVSGLITIPVTLRDHLGVNDTSGDYVDAWYPLLIEYGNRNVNGAEFRLEISTDGGSSWDYVTSDMLSPWGIYDTHDNPIRSDSHYEQLSSIAQSFGYQYSAEGQSLESGYFPAIVRPKVEVGRKSNKVISDSDLNVEDYQTVINGDDMAEALLGDGTGLADSGSGSPNAQLVVEALNYLAPLEALPMLLSEYEQWGDVGYPPLLAQRVQSLMALRSSPWEEVSTKVTGEPELTDTFPLTGNMALLQWRAGDHVRLNLPRIGVVDGSPRQILAVNRPITNLGATGFLQAPELSFRQRPRDLKTYLRQLQRRYLSKQRTFQGQYVQTTSSLGGSDGNVAIVALPNNLNDIVKAEVVVVPPVDTLAPLYLYINGVKIDGYDPITAPGRYDISAYVDRFGPSPSMQVELKTS
jgi:hypothetical protein